LCLDPDLQPPHGTGSAGFHEKISKAPQSPGGAQAGEIEVGIKLKQNLFTAETQRAQREMFFSFPLRGRKAKILNPMGMMKF